MPDYQFWTLVGMIGAGFAWVIHQIKDVDKRVSELDRRLTIIETILGMMGMPIKEKK